MFHVQVKCTVALPLRFLLLQCQEWKNSEISGKIREETIEHVLPFFEIGYGFLPPDLGSLPCMVVEVGSADERYHYAFVHSSCFYDSRPNLVGLRESTPLVA
ncbi:hypothetical protein V6N13_059678 [Hibiscus sabdariffa]